MHSHIRNVLRGMTAVLAITGTMIVFAQGTTNPWQENTITWLSKFAQAVAVENVDAATEDAMKPYTEVISGTDITFDMAPVKGGKFMMGSTADEQETLAADPDTAPDKFDNAAEGPQHEVQISPFWMGKCEVTWEEYEAWSVRLEITKRQNNPDFKETEREKIADAMIRPTPAYTDMTFDMGKAKRPAIAMSLYAAQMYCKWLSAKTGRYYRLPTEAEWESACRAGTDSPFSFGADPAKLGDYGWNYDNSDDKYQPVGQKKPNPWGLYDMHGNVREWCLDQYFVDGYQKQLDAAGGKTLVDPFMAFQNSKRYPGVARGGAWYDDAQNCRSAARFPSHEGWNSDDPQMPKSIWFESSEKWLGFRVVRPFKTPTVEEAAAFEPDPETALNYGRLNPRQKLEE